MYATIAASVATMLSAAVRPRRRLGTEGSGNANATQTVLMVLFARRTSSGSSAINVPEHIMVCNTPRKGANQRRSLTIRDRASRRRNASEVARGVTVDPSNEIEAFAFKHFTGPLQVQQNGSVNSSVSQNMAIDAFKLRGIGVGFFAAATSTNTVSGNTATNASIPSVDSEGTDNSIEDQAFKHAKGAVQVQQNRSINSSTGQNMDIDPISNPGGGAGQVSATASLTSNVNGNSAAGSSVSGGNSITDGAFKHAKGSVQVQQYSSNNSPNHQNM